MRTTVVDNDSDRARKSRAGVVVAAMDVFVLRVCLTEDCEWSERKAVERGPALSHVW
jgi:hypothetical protein